VGDVQDLDGLVNLAHRLLVANRERYDHVTTGDARAGKRTWVYDRAGRPCRRCGATVRVESQGEAATREGRLSYWCPRCQPGPVPARVAAVQQPRA
jgi:endonuclease-8